MTDTDKSNFDVLVEVALSTGELSDVPMSVDNNNEVVNSSLTSYGETVLCSMESLSRLPDHIYSLWGDYNKGYLPKVEPGEVNELLEKWFNNESISQLPTNTSPDYPGLQPSVDTKRRRVDGDV